MVLQFGHGSGVCEVAGVDEDVTVGDLGGLEAVGIGDADEADWVWVKGR